MGLEQEIKKALSENDGCCMDDAEDQAKVVTSLLKSIAPFICPDSVYIVVKEWRGLIEDVKVYSNADAVLTELNGALGLNCQDIDELEEWLDENNEERAKCAETTWSIHTSLIH